ncbi:MAG: hypothetical protein ACUVRP_01945 [Chlorobiales bacterium]
MPIVFQAENWQIVVVLSSCTLLATLLLTRELRRPLRKRFGLRLALNIIAILALALLGLQPTRLTPTAPKKIALLTETVNSDIVDSLIKRNDFEVFAIYLNPQARYIQDAGVLARNFPTSEIHIFGSGLGKADLTRLYGRRLFFHQSELPNGIIELNASQSITLGESLIVKGLVRGKFNRLEFRASEVLVDSLTNLDEETPFEFSFTPKQLGKLNLSLVLDGKEEKWGVCVLPPKPLSILVLQSKPTFETNYLKNFLTENGYRFAMRLMVGKARYREEFWNMPSQSLVPLSRKLLSRFDLVMSDGQTLSGLTASERIALENAVMQDGLGIFVTEIDSVLYREPSLKFFQPFRFRVHQAREQAISGKEFKSPPISLDAATIMEDLGVQSLFEDSDGRSVAAFHQKGVGRIAISLVQNTYQWRLEGKQSVYASYWANLLSAIAKRTRKMRITTPMLSFTHKPIEFQIQTAMDSPRIILQEHLQETVVPLRQEMLNPTTWHGRYWAKESGWIAFKVNGEEPLWAFVSDETAFEALQKETRRKETMKIVQLNAVQEVGQTKKFERDAMLMLLCALCLMLAIGGLWAEQKL